ncbi:MAG: aminopeptidase, partial [Corynebacterium sp.]|nr:aminopeptidase [Corynebacterium sp.]
MKRIPNLPRPTPEITVGTTVTGSDVVDCRVLVDEKSTADLAADLAADGVWEVRVPAEPTALTDLAELADEPRLGDDGWRAAGAVLSRRLSTLIDAHPVRAKRHTVQIRVPRTATVQNLRNLAMGIVLGGRSMVVTRKDAAAEVRSVHLDVSDVSGSDGNGSDGGDVAMVKRVEDAVHRGRVFGAATMMARDIDAVPSPTATSVWWRRKAKAVLGDVPGTRVKTHGRGWLQRKGFGGLLATASAGTSVNDPDGEDEVGLVEMFWDPAAAEGDLTDERPDVLLVGGATVP